MAALLRWFWFVIWIVLGIVAVVLLVKGAVLAGIFLGGAALCLLVLGDTSLKNLLDALFTPTYSLRSMARDDSFSFSILLVFMGGLFLGFYAALLKTFVNSSFADYAQSVIDDALSGYANPVYRDVLAQDGFARMKNTFDLVYSNNIVWLPVAWVVFWLAVGVLYWLGGRLFGSTVGLAGTLSCFAYWSALTGVIAGYFIIHGFGTAFLMLGGGASLGVVDVIGALLILASLVYLFISTSQGLEISMVQAVVVFIIWLVVFGGIAAGVGIYQATPAFQEFLRELQTTNPAR